MSFLDLISLRFKRYFHEPSCQEIFNRLPENFQGDRTIYAIGQGYGTVTVIKNTWLKLSGKQVASLWYAICKVFTINPVVSSGSQTHR